MAKVKSFYWDRIEEMASDQPEPNYDDEPTNWTSPPPQMRGGRSPRRKEKNKENTP